MGTCMISAVLLDSYSANRYGRYLTPDGTKGGAFEQSAERKIGTEAETRWVYLLGNRLASSWYHYNLHGQDFKLNV